MKINDNAFSERIATPNTRTQSTGQATSESSSAVYGTSDSADQWQPSDLASRLQTTQPGDTTRAARLNQIAQAVKSNSFQVDSMQISKALVSEAVAGQAR
jgi:anti-sigma28 factor (negative regulator of flagellin synthesis)